MRVFFPVFLAGVFASSGWAQDSAGKGAALACPDSAASGYSAAIDAICKKAASGDAMAQYETGLIFYWGTHRMDSAPEKAAAWFEKAARQGNADAMYLLAEQYTGRREGVKPDAAKAFAWYEKAAVKGHSLAQVSLAYLYMDGRGVTKDEATARQWLEKARASGCFYAQRALDPDDIILVVDPGMRAKEGDPAAQYYMARYGDGARKRVNYDRVEKWYRQSAEQGYAPAQVALGILYTQDAPGKKNLEKAAELFGKAAEKGDAEGRHELALLELQGHEPGIDRAQAVTLLRQAVAQNHRDAARTLGELYRRGISVNQNPAVARAWYRHAALKNRFAVEQMLSVTRVDGGDERRR
ncbi:sel1 repeat family protein [Oxalobacter sp. OttesenSCG-928-P03]|nr:sel1 repeat family protein [Oxalobacter sp. OttesenSCG-928-P03]